jgi:endonuclease/exonuclease/phosphatase family metal-dependent hydrolase
VLLQEMDLEGTEKLARALGCNLVYHAAAVHPHHGRLFGNAVLSPWPIVAHDLIVLPHPHPLSGQRRIAVQADLLIAGRPLRAISVHLATPVTPLDARIEQAAAVAAAAADAPGPVVVGGDLNTVTDRGRVLVLRTFRKAGLRPAGLPTRPTIRKRIWLRPDLELALDHILVGKLTAGSAGVVGEAEASDHLPVWARCGWPPPGPGSSTNHRREGVPQAIHE